MTSLQDPLFLITACVFVCVATPMFLGLRAFAQRGRVRRRHRSFWTVPAGADPGPSGNEQSWISIDPARLGFDVKAQRVLRSDLIRAGFFGGAAVPAYAVLRLVILVLVPAVGLVLVPMAYGIWNGPKRAMLGAVLIAVAYYMPKAYLSRRQRSLELKYRLVFPDFIDMLVVCVNAGLSLEAAMDRASQEFGDESFEFRANLDMMASEMRAGKSTSDALRAMADRLGLPEARSFVGLLHQTIELGTDVAQALSTFSDEMRDKRMSRAEEKAAGLPPKLTLPLGLFIFPVVIIAVLAPAVLKVLSAVHR